MASKHKSLSSGMLAVLFLLLLGGLGLADESVDFNQGLNLFGYPVEISPGYSSYELLEDFGNQSEIASIERYNPDDGAFEEVFWLNGAASGADFLIRNEEGYLIHARTDLGSKLFYGIRDCSPVSLKKGFNLVPFPCATGYDSYSLLYSIGDASEVESVLGYNALSGFYQMAFYSGGIVTGDLFDINHGEAYIVTLKVDKTWNPPSGGTQVGGNITADTRWPLIGSPYIAAADVVVEPGVTLTIDPGVVIKFERNTQLTINGSLIASGTAARPIIFTSQEPVPAPGDWQGIYFGTDSDALNCSLTYCQIEYAVNGIYCYTSSPTIEHCRIKKCTVGIRCYSAAAPVIAGNKIYDNTDTGVYCSNNSSPQIKGNEIYRNTNRGIYIYRSSPAVFNNIISSNGQGIYCAAISSPSITNNTLADNLKGIYNSGATPVISNCILWNNDDDLYGASARYSDIEDGDSGDGNISTNPMFVNSAAGNYHITLVSPCINAGASADAPPTDIDGDVRVDGAPDIGADEFVGGSIPGDLPTVYVDVHNTGFENGTPGYPFNTIQEGIDSLGDELGIVTVAEGTYQENIVIRNYCLLQGGGADLTIIDGGGSDAVHF